MKNAVRSFVLFASVAGLSAASLAQSDAAARDAVARYDQPTQQAVVQKLSSKSQFKSVNASVQEGIVTLTGTVHLYQAKLDAAGKVRKMDHVQGVRNLITVDGEPIPDQKLQTDLNRKLKLDRIGYFDNTFNYITVAVKDGVVSVDGETASYPARDSALALVQRAEGVKDVVNNIKMLPNSLFDDSIRRAAVRELYGDNVLGRYASDPAHPIRIIVENGHLSLYGTVEREMDKNIAGVRASGVEGAFSVQNNLVVSR